mmetsp:Transcript_12271/g.17255  ORF Transcript_12271/g.17255 Transcript_12271/m.17255 type:complete len:251 (+) Transcript_12271:226-978(+)
MGRHYTTIEGEIYSSSEVSASTALAFSSSASSSSARPVCSRRRSSSALMYSMLSGSWVLASLRRWRSAMQVTHLAFPSRLNHQKRKYPRAAAMPMTRKEPRTVKPLESCSKQAERPRRMRGRAKNMTRMYTMGNPRQTRVALPSLRARLRGTRRMKGMGYQMRIPEMLKKRWARAVCMAVILSETRAAMTAVKVVPMLAPRVRGYICSSWMTPMPTRGVRVEVVMDEDWTRMVMPVPMTMARYPLMLVAL